MDSYLSRAGGFAVALVLLFCSHLATVMAEPADGAVSSESVTVTATRTLTSVADSLSPTTVLSQADIATRQVVSFQDLLAGEPGIQISNNGGLGKVSSVFLRGTNADQVLVLVNGIRMGSSSIGTTAFQYLPVDSIDHIEIVRGPLSSLYGSAAVGGVIQIFTRQPTVDGFSGDADAAAGSHRTSTIGANLGVKSGPLSFGISASNLTSDGYRNCTGAPYLSPSSPGGGCYVDDPTPDGYHNASGSAEVRYQFSPTGDVEAAVIRAQGGTRYAGSYTNHEDFVQQAASLSAHVTATPTLKITLQVGQSLDQATEKLDGVEPAGSRFDTSRDSASVQADWHVTDHQLLTFGTDYLRDHLSSDAGFPVTSRAITGVFGEYQTTFGSQQLAMSARHDSNSQFGDRTTGSVAWGYRLTRELRVTASFGTAFHAPSFDDLYFPFFGNPALKPETARSVDIGLDQRFTAICWSLHAFQSRIHDLIGFDAIQFAPENTDEARIRGVEFSGGATRRAWSVDVSTSWLGARNRTQGSPNDGHELLRRSRISGRLELAHSWATVRASARIQSAGRRYEDLANALPLGGYTTADVLLEWSLEKHWILQGKVANATNRHYETAQNYPQDGRNYLVTLRYRPASR